MEQNNPPQTNESQSNPGRYEWLKTIIFFGVVLLICILAIRIITPFIFTEYVPTIVGLEGSTEQIDSTGDSGESEPEEVEPAESPEDDSSDETLDSEVENNDAESSDETTDSAVEEETIDPVPTEDATSNKTDDSEEEAEQNYSIYIVRPGESLTSIAKAHNLTLAELVAANELVDPNLVQAGQEIRIPE